MHDENFCRNFGGGYAVGEARHTRKASNVRDLYDPRAVTVREGLVIIGLVLESLGDTESPTL